MPEFRKVVHVMRRFDPERWGGTEAVVFNLSREFIGQGLESTVHCTAMFLPEGKTIHDGVEVVRHRYVFPWFGLSEAAREALRMKGGSPLSLSLFQGLLRERGVSLIHTHVQLRLGGMARTAARLRRIPYVVSIHGGHYTLPPSLVDKMVAPVAGKLEWGKVFGFLFGSRRVIADADAVICVGRSEYDEVRKRFPKKLVYLVPNGVDVSRFGNADGRLFRDRHGFGPDERIVLCVSRIDYQKNQLGLVRAFARFAEARPGYRLVLLGPVGYAAYKQEIEREIDALGIQHKVSLIDGLRPDDPMLASAFKAADLFVLPSVHEPFGIVILEAWAAGVPVLASRVGGIAGFVEDRKTALLVDPGCEDGLARGLCELAEDRTLCAELVRNAREHVAREYDWSAIARRMREIYEEVLRRSP